MEDQIIKKRKCATLLATLLRTSSSTPLMCCECPLRSKCKERRSLDQTLYDMFFNVTCVRQKSSLSSKEGYKKHRPDLDNCREILFKALNDINSANILKEYITEQKNKNHENDPKWNDRKILLEKTERLIYDAR